MSWAKTHIQSAFCRRHLSHTPGLPLWVDAMVHEFDESLDVVTGKQQAAARLSRPWPGSVPVRAGVASSGRWGIPQLYRYLSCVCPCARSFLLWTDHAISVLYVQGPNLVSPAEPTHEPHFPLTYPQPICQIRSGSVSTRPWLGPASAGKLAPGWQSICRPNTFSTLTRSSPLQCTRGTFFIASPSLHSTRTITSTNPHSNVDDLTNIRGDSRGRRLQPPPSRNRQTSRLEQPDDGIMDSNMGGTFATSSSSALADTGATYYQLATESNATTTAAITNALKFATSKSIRTSTIILASFNSVAAFTTALGIIYGCRSYKKRMQSRSSEPSVTQHLWESSSQLTPDRPSGLFFIHSAEVFPLVLSLGITIQSITFAAAQSVGLQALLSRGCTLVAIFMLPGERPQLLGTL